MPSRLRAPLFFALGQENDIEVATNNQSKWILSMTNTNLIPELGLDAVRVRPIEVHNQWELSNISLNSIIRQKDPVLTSSLSCNRAVLVYAPQEEPLAKIRSRSYL